ncbi:hypothetical protein GJ496_000712 [Pomphorhynchus laevis]|nr:hypothetical protein GJ496_000712 [Pomphorhynchus laevis]
MNSILKRVCECSIDNLEQLIAVKSELGDHTFKELIADLDESIKAVETSLHDQKSHQIVNLLKNRISHSIQSSGNSNDDVTVVNETVEQKKCPVCQKDFTETDEDIKEIVGCGHKIHRICAQAIRFNQMLNRCPALYCTRKFEIKE